MLRLNIGGKSFVLKHESLERAPNAFLAQFAKCSHEQRMSACDAFMNEQEYFFERSPKIAEPIIGYYMTGYLHKPVDVCLERFLQELRFWGLHMSLLSSCCIPAGAEALIRVNNGCATVNENGEEKEKEKENKKDPDPFDGLCCAEKRRKLWTIFEEPSSGKDAKIFACLSMFFVLISVLGLILGSMQQFQTEVERSLNDTDNFTLEEAVLNEIIYDQDRPHDVLVVAEYLCISWFTIEYLLRLVVAPKKLDFITSPLNLIDLLTIVPFYAELCLSLLGVNADELRKMHGPMLVARILRVCRSARIFKLARYSTGLQVFGDTMKKSVRELSMLSMFLITGIVFFSTVMYFLERDLPNTKFYSIPASCWWGVITMTTVGYGDLVPHTTGGKMVATIASVCGIIVLAFPISMIVEKFSDAQDQPPDPALPIYNNTTARLQAQPSIRMRRLRSWIV